MPLVLLAAVAGVVAAGTVPAQPPPATGGAATSGPAEPAPVPSGLDLLYGDRVAFAPSGEPVVTVGLASGERRLALRSRSPMQVDFWEGGVQKRAGVRPGDALEVTVRRATPARRQHYVDLEGVRFGDEAGLVAALARWRERGYPAVAALEEGLVLGMRGRVLDNREYRLVLDAASAAAAGRLAAEVFARFGARAAPKARLGERPWGELLVKAGGAPLGLATSYVRVVAPGGLVQVDQVEFARGYAWHGREDRSYHGEVYVAVDADGTLAAVNVLGVETVLEGVVPAELFASSPPEALKAQAVAARNHLLAKLGRRHHDDPFQICGEQHCQVYAGVAKEDPRTSAAVRATAGQALFFGDELVECAYSASCGGHTEDNDVVWGDAASPALRGRPDFDAGATPGLAAFAGALTEATMPAWIATRPASYCALARPSKPERIRWQKRFTAAELARLLAADHARIGRLRDLVVDERGPGGRVVTLRLVGTRGTDTVVHELPIRRLFGNLSSGAFVLDLARDAAGELEAATFRGAGWGHGVGMCQLGAVGRAEAGHDYRQILSYYYNGAQVDALY